jgi:hypothetical protein
MKYLFQADINCEETSFSCDYALIDLSIETLQQIQRRFDLFDRLNTEDSSLERLTFVDFSPVWFNPYELDDDCETSERVEAFIGVKGYGECESLPVSSDDLEKCSARTEADRMEISGHYVWWSCAPKHTNFEASTSLVAREDIAEMLRIATAEPALA